jgi:hypothetical protein
VSSENLKRVANAQTGQTLNVLPRYLEKDEPILSGLKATAPSAELKLNSDAA